MLSRVKFKSLAKSRNWGLLSWYYVRVSKKWNPVTLTVYTKRNRWCDIFSGKWEENKINLLVPHFHKMSRFLFRVSEEQSAFRPSYRPLYVDRWHFPFSLSREPRTLPFHLISPVTRFSGRCFMVSRLHLRDMRDVREMAERTGAREWGSRFECCFARARTHTHIPNFPSW